MEYSSLGMDFEIADRTQAFSAPPRQAHGTVHAGRQGPTLSNRKDPPDPNEHMASHSFLKENAMFLARFG